MVIKLYYSCQHFKKQPSVSQFSIAKAWSTWNKRRQQVCVRFITGATRQETNESKSTRLRPR